jgi:hypothetical protein
VAALVANHDANPADGAALVDEYADVFRPAPADAQS